MKRNPMTHSAVGLLAGVMLLLGAGEAWAQVRCEARDLEKVSSHFRLAAGGPNSDDPYGVLDLTVTYSFCEEGISDVTLETSSKPKDLHFTRFDHLVRYFNKLLTATEKAKFRYADKSAYTPSDSHEAFVNIVWSYEDTSRQVIPDMNNNFTEGHFNDHDSGNSVIRIDTSSRGEPTSEVARHGGIQWYSAEASGLSKPEPTSTPPPPR